MSHSSRKKLLSTLATGAFAALGILASSTCLIAAAEKPVPTLRVGYINTTHHIPFVAAMEMGEKFKGSGVYLKKKIEKEKYELYSNGKKLANLDIILNKSGSETATMFAMKRLDLALASTTAIMSGIDKGTRVKMLCPTHVDGIGFVVPKNSPISTWEAFISYAKNAKRPIPVGYHSPTSAPKIILENALTNAGIKVTENPTNSSANVLLMDLKSTSNFIPALTSKQVEALVAPSPFPEVAQVKGVGKIVTDLRDLPPKGHWRNFPCCVMAAREETISDHPEQLAAMVKLMAASAEWCNAHRNEVAAISEKWMGTPAEAVKKSTIVYTIKPSKNWMKGIDTYMAMLNKLGDFTGRLAGKALKNAKDLLFDFRFLPKS